MHLNASQITKMFGQRTIVKDATFNINQGEVAAIFGPNGAGKTTFIKILATLLRPTTGILKIDGTDVITDYVKVRNSLGVIVHEHLAYPTLTPLENLRFFAKMYGIANIDTHCRKRLDEVGLSRFIHEPLNIFSRGMTQRFMIARALLHNPSILLLDEPFSGLDAAAIRFAIERIKQERKNGKSVVITTHNIELGYSVGTKFLFMINGELEEIAQKDDMDVGKLIQMYEERLMDKNSE